jgi:UDP-2-acetamido-2-deoxy-ribo-hexuluronate aminotransferase
MTSSSAGPVSPIPFVDLQAQYARLKPEIDARMATVLDHGRFIMGPEVLELEGALAKRAGVRHGIACASGTDALLVALMAANVGPGDAVFLPTFTFTASAEVVLTAGAEPVFVDVDQDSFNIDVEDLERRVAAVSGRLRPRVVIAVDLFGAPADYDALEAVAKRHDLVVVADAAQSYGATLHNRPVGGLAPITTTSFFPAKPLGCYGDGGALLTDDDALADVMRSIRAHGKGSGKYDIVRAGLNSRLDTLQAAVVLGKLTVFDDELAARRHVASRYNDRLGELVKIPLRPNDAQSAWAQYTIQTKHRDALADSLKAQGIPTAIYYPRPMHLQPAYAKFDEGVGAHPISESLSECVLSLPMHPYLDDATLDRICNAVETALRDASVT